MLRMRAGSSSRSRETPGVSRSRDVRAFAVFACCVVAACGGSGPAQGPSSPLPLQPGRQLLSLIGAALSTDPQFPPCAPLGVPRDGTSVDTYVTLTAEGDEWAGRSPTAAEGTIELRIRAAERTARGYAVTGTIRGVGIDIGLKSIIRDVRVTFAAAPGSGSAVLQGETLSPMSAIVGGRAAGTITFSDSNGLASSCQAVQWAMQPY